MLPSVVLLQHHLRRHNAQLSQEMATANTRWDRAVQAQLESQQEVSHLQHYISSAIIYAGTLQCWHHITA